jgi:hypothetical protein
MHNMKIQVLPIYHTSLTTVVPYSSRDLSSTGVLCCYRFSVQLWVQLRRELVIHAVRMHLRREKGRSDYVSRQVEITVVFDESIISM